VIFLVYIRQRHGVIYRVVSNFWHRIELSQAHWNTIKPYLGNNPPEDRRCLICLQDGVWWTATRLGNQVTFENQDTGIAIQAQVEKMLKTFS